MGGKQSVGLGAKSTALEVWEHFTIEYGRNILENKTVIVTGKKETLDPSSSASQQFL
jgi:hypothetical protein